MTKEPTRFPAKINPQIQELAQYEPNCTYPTPIQKYNTSPSFYLLQLEHALTANQARAMKEPHILSDS
jgi:hypothetical protein